jgi:hypothetical protein
MNEILLAFAISYYKIYGLETWKNNDEVYIYFHDLIKDLSLDDYRAEGCRQSNLVQHLHTVLPIICNDHDIINLYEFRINGFARTITEHHGDASYSRMFRKMAEKRPGMFIQDAIMLIAGLTYIYPDTDTVVYLMKYALTGEKRDSYGIQETIDINIDAIKDIKYRDDIAKEFNKLKHELLANILSEHDDPSDDNHLEQS